MTITVDSPFATLATDVVGYYQSLVSVGQNYSESLSVAGELSSIDFGSWKDNISSSLQKFTSSLSQGLQNISSDLSGGSFPVILSDVTALGNTLSYCDQVKQQVQTYEGLLNAPFTYTYYYQDGVLVKTERNEHYYTLLKAIEQGNTLLGTLVTDCNSILNHISSIQFGTDSSWNAPDSSTDVSAFLTQATEFMAEIDYDSLGENGNPATGADGDIPPIDYQPIQSGSDNENGNSPAASLDPAVREQVANNFDYDDYQDSMGNLFQSGIFEASITYNGNTIVLRSTGTNGEFALYDNSGNRISDQTFTRDNVLMQGDGSYPIVVAEAAIDYFAMLEANRQASDDN